MSSNFHSMSISELIRAEHTGEFHLGKRCKPLRESITTERNGKVLHKWRKIERAPLYFNQIETDAGIFKLYKRVKNEKKSEKLNCLFKRAFQPDILRYVDNFGVCQHNLNELMKKGFRKKQDSESEGWVPAGINGGQQSSAKLPIEAVTSLYTTTVSGPGVSFGGLEAMAKIDNDFYKQLHNSTYRIMEGDYLMKEVFNLNKIAVKLINEKKSTLLMQVHVKCAQFRVTRLDVDKTRIGEHEDVFEVKLGVYFVPSKGKVYKFLDRPINFPEFYSEVSVGLYIEEAVKGVCGITSVCPEHFCFEMKYCGPDLDMVVKNDQKRDREVCMYNVIMMQSMPGLFMVPLLSGLLTHKRKNTMKPLCDSATAQEVFTIFRKKVLDELPFFLCELINIVIRLGQQGLVNLDIKADNFVVDGCTGQPKMIDLNIVLPFGHRNLCGVTCVEEFEKWPHTPPEYLRGQPCFDSSMSFGLAHTLRHIITTLSESGNCAATSLHNNLHLSEWIARAYSEQIDTRPAPHIAAVHIGSAFPFQKNIRDMFLNPKHTIKYI